MAKKKKKKQTVKQIISRLEKKVYNDLGEEDSHYQEGYSDGMRELARYVNAK